MIQCQCREQATSRPSSCLMTRSASSPEKSRRETESRDEEKRTQGESDDFRWERVLCVRPGTAFAAEVTGK